MNPIILSIVMCKELGKMGSLALIWQLVLMKENSELKPVKL